MVMFHMRRGDLFEDPDAEVFVATMNCKGVPGAGIAKKLADRFPEVVERYKAQCRQGFWKPGQIAMFTADDGTRLLLVSTKDEWWDPSKLEWVEEILKKIALSYERYDYSSLSLPHLGCGNGKLDKSVVRALMQKHLGDTVLDLYLY